MTSENGGDGRRAERGMRFIMPWLKADLLVGFPTPTN